MVGIHNVLIATEIACREAPTITSVVFVDGLLADMQNIGLDAKEGLFGLLWHFCPNS